MITSSMLADRSVGEPRIGAHPCSVLCEPQLVFGSLTVPFYLIWLSLPIFFSSCIQVFVCKIIRLDCVISLSYYLGALDSRMSIPGGSNDSWKEIAEQNI